MSTKALVNADALLCLPSDDETQIFQDTQNRQPTVGMECQICFVPLDKMSPKRRQRHYDAHLEGSWASFSLPPIEFEAVVASTSKHGNKFPKQFQFQREKKFWCSATSGPPPGNFTPGLIPIIKGALEKSCAFGMTCRAALCHDNAIHIYRELSDAGWGCGYRNYMMACASLMTQTQQPQYSALLDDLPPSIRSLQQTIEEAWKEGFDPDGAQQLKKLVGVPKWVGTAGEAKLNPRAELVDFDLRRSNKGVGVVLDWIIEYFSSEIEDELGGNEIQSHPVRSTNRMPLILQHNGHSRTVVGYEIDRHGTTNLIIFDPSHQPQKKIRRTALENFTGRSSTSKTSDHFITDFFKPVSKGVKYLNKKQHGSSPQQARTGKGEKDTVPELEAVVGEGNGQSQGSIPAEGHDNPLSPTEILRHFKVKLKNRNQYQILYFPLKDPLTNIQKAGKKSVLSTKIC